ncbi:hypothetical protein LPJ56_002454 [Coemansia sp. RSA 2599]|nr:hypothetical protein LPJ56_002454 [Coemansia sp. RSA 2599]
MADSGDTGACLRRQFAQKLRLQLPGSSTDAVAILKQGCANNAEREERPMAYPDGGRIQLLRMTAVGAVPAAFFQKTWFRLFVNAAAEDSQRYVNGLVRRLSQAENDRTGSCAALARIERSKNPADMADPFSASPADKGRGVDWLPDGHAYALVYMARDSVQASWHLVLHLLQQPRTLVPLASVVAAGQPRAATGELEFIRMLARKSSEQARIQRTLSTETLMKSSESLGRRNSSFGMRPRRGRMTLTDIETMMKEQTLASASNSPNLSLDASDQSFAQPGGSATPCAAESSAPCDDVELKNKRIAKQLIITSLKERGVGRSHPDFAALWSQIYRSLKFAMRDKIARREYAPRELKAEADKHASFYCSSTV